eukprot:TRINITY_DN1537_c0_g2_i1.p1 TRINITY_DN1537_c0_g2~~TRINITY_DN1537_c0_g2_i1.p1  ORF type:complete len:1903 (-),score=492.44 TRINITY_DN1537_c0_g2_i1:11-5278(-)
MSGDTTRHDSLEDAVVLMDESPAVEPQTPTAEQPSSTAHKYAPTPAFVSRVMQLHSGQTPGIKVPPLQLPHGAVMQSPLKPTRSSRRFAQSPSTPQHVSLVAVSEPVADPKRELLVLATGLGEACALADLSALFDRRKAGFQLAQPTQRAETPDSELVAHQRQSHSYNIKRLALQKLLKHDFSTGAVPVNLLMSELLAARRSPILARDAGFCDDIFALLRIHAQQVNLQLQREVFSGGPRTSRKVDVFVWRINQALSSLISQATPLLEVAVHLEALGMYLKQCETRSMSAHVMDVCIESLGYIQAFLYHHRAGGHVTPRLAGIARVASAMLCVWDELIRQCNSLLVAETLAQILIATPETLRWLAWYLTVITQRKAEANFGKHLVQNWQQSVLQHFISTLRLLYRYVELGGDIVTPSANALLSKLGFLLKPESGGLPAMLRSGLPVHLQLLVLEFFETIFRWPRCPLLRGEASRTIAEQFIHTHYHQFVRLYCSQSTDDDTLALCTAHLKVLRSLSGQRTPEIIGKLYELRIMEFLVHTVGVEVGLQARVALPQLPRLPTAKLLMMPSSLEKVGTPAVPLAPERPATDTSGSPILEARPIPFKVPGLKLGAHMTKAGEVVEGKAVTIHGADSLPAVADGVVDAKAAPAVNIVPVATATDSAAPAAVDTHPVPPRTPFKVPGLKLTAQMTKAGEVSVGSDVAIHADAPTGTTNPVVAALGTTPVAEPQPAEPQRTSFKIPGLKLTAQMTKAGEVSVGSDVAIHADAPTGTANPVVAALGSVPVALPAINSTANVAAAAPSPTPFKIPGLKLTAQMTKAGEAADGKEVTIHGSDSASAPAPAPPAVANSLAAKAEAPPADDTVEPKRTPFKIPGLKLTAQMTKAGEVVAGDAVTIHADQLSVAPAPVPPPQSVQSVATSLSPPTTTATSSPVIPGLILDSTAVVSATDSPVLLTPVVTQAKIPAAATPAATPAVTPFKVPGLRLNAEITKAGETVEGRDVTIHDRFVSAPPALSSNDRAPITIPGLKLASDITKAGETVEGKDVVIFPHRPSVSSTKPTSGSMFTTGEPASAKRLTAKARDFFPPDEVEAVGGQLTSIEAQVDNKNPKMQVAADVARRNRVEGLMAAPTHRDSGAEYFQERARRKVFRSEELHCAMLELVLSMMIGPSDTLEPLYADVDPSRNGNLNILYYLHAHLNHPSNESVLPVLSDRVREDSQKRLLKLMCRHLFSSNLYTLGDRIGQGAFGIVHRATMPFNPHTVAIKLTPIPRHLHDRCTLVDLFTEITVLEKFQTARVSQLFDYGVDGENYWMVMKLYKCSLKSWREHFNPGSSVPLPLYLNIYQQILDAVNYLNQHHVVHFDIKADNILLEPLDGISEQEFYNPTTSNAPFTIRLGDFGESAIISEVRPYTTRNRGTEPIKSPEMLRLSWGGKGTQDFDRRKRQGAGAASDVWSLGCLLYEIITGAYLFYDDVESDFVQLFHRVHSDNPDEMIPDFRRHQAQNNKEVFDLLFYVLKKDPQMRPSCEDVMKRVSTLLHGARVPRGATPRGVTPRTTPRIANSSGVTPRNQAIRPSPPTALQFANVGLSPLSPLREQQMLLRNKLISVLPKLFVASATVASDRAQLYSAGITHVVDLTERECAVFPDDFEYLHLRPSSTPDRMNLLVWLSMAVGFISKAHERGGKVLIVSTHGIGRAPAVACAYVMDTMNLDFFRAFVLLKDRVLSMEMHPFYIAQLCYWRDERVVLDIASQPRRSTIVRM